MVIQFSIGQSLINSFILKIISVGQCVLQGSYCGLFLLNLLIIFINPLVFVNFFIFTIVAGQFIFFNNKIHKNVRDTQIAFTLSNRSSSGSSYNLFKHNCNNFSEDIAQFLCGVSIPKYILELPNQVLNSSLGAALPSLVSELEKSARPIAEEQDRFPHREASPDFEQLNSQIEEARSDVRLNGVNKDKKE